MQHQLPSVFIDSLAGLKGFHREEFEKIHASGVQVSSVRMNPAKYASADGPAWLPAPVERIPWSSMGYYLGQRPSYTFDPLFHGGVYYVQEASSMFLEQAVRQTVDLDRPLRVLDLCAAPGGKSTLLQSLIGADSLLVSNEVIRSRAGVLQENIVKWGSANVIVTNNDPRDMGRLENYFDLIVVDAPCSGSGLFRREPEAIREWSPAGVEACALRQQRILSDCWPALKEGGMLIYSTCSYSRQEDEDILDWMAGEIDGEPVPLKLDSGWHIVETRGEKGWAGYRFYPDQLKGEGFFIAGVRKKEGGQFHLPKLKNPAVEILARKEQDRLAPWVEATADLQWFRHNELVHALPASLIDDLRYLQSALYIRKAGVLGGQLAAKEFIPEHELALSTVAGKELPVLPLGLEEAILYLRKEELRLDNLGGAGSLRGWALAQYEGVSLGWVKVLPNRINNYYPREWRILKRAD